jgi:hypothetical protein
MTIQQFSNSDPWLFAATHHALKTYGRVLTLDNQPKNPRIELWINQFSPNYKQLPGNKPGGALS